MHMLPTFLVTISIIIFKCMIIKAQYDGTIANTVHVDDLENERDQIASIKQKQQQQENQIHRYYQTSPTIVAPKPSEAINHQSAIQYQRYTEQYARPQKHQNIKSPIAKVQPHRVLPLHLTVSDNRQPQPQQQQQQQQYQTTNTMYETAAANRYSIGVNPYIYNGQANNNIDDERNSNEENNLPSQNERQNIFEYNHGVPLTELLQFQHLSDGYALNQQSGAFVIVPPFDEQNGFIATQNPTSAPLPPTQAAIPPLYLQRPPSSNNNKQIVTFPANEAIEYAPNAIRYLSNNAAAQNDAIEYAHEQQFANNALSIQRPPPLKEFGNNAAVSHTLRRPSIQYPLQSNQFAFAPAHPDRGPLAQGSAAIPYPPSFISITTERPSATNIQAPLRSFYGRPRAFNPSPTDPVPDFFANRQPKSLLDSYIPSWEIAKMLQSTAFNSDPIYTSAATNNSQFKRELVKSASTKATTTQEKSLVKNNIDEMQMTA